MSRILVVYYSMFGGHVKTLAEAIADGVSSVDGTEVVVKRVPELMPAEVKAKYGVDHDDAPIAQPSELADYDAIIFGTPTRFGNMCSQMRNFLDQTGGLWVKAALLGKVGSVFVSTGTGWGNETTITSFHNTLIHHGMIIVGVPNNTPELFYMDSKMGGTCYGATTLAGSDGKRPVDEIEKKIAFAQGKYVAEITNKLFPKS